MPRTNDGDMCCLKYRTKKVAVLEHEKHCCHCHFVFALLFRLLCSFVFLFVLVLLARMHRLRLQGQVVAQVRKMPEFEYFTSCPL